jgi:hypothetical protein
MSSLRLAALALKAGNKLCGWAVSKVDPLLSARFRAFNAAGDIHDADKTLVSRYLK